MIVLYTSDIHVDPEHLDRLLKAAAELRAEAVIIGGDLIPVRGRTINEVINEQGRWIKEAMIPAFATFRRDFPNASIFLDFGNDDLMATRHLLEEKDGNELNLIHGRVMPLGAKFSLAAYMVIPPTPFVLKDREKVDCHDRTGLDGNVARTGIRTDGGKERDCEIDPSDGTMEDGLKELTDILQSPPWDKRPFLLVAHSPPLDTALDIIPGGQHVGSLAIRRFIERQGQTGRLRISLHGHIHESPFISGKVYDRIADVPCFNLGQRFGELRALVFDLEDIKGSINHVIFDKKIKLHKVSL